MKLREQYTRVVCTFKIDSLQKKCFALKSPHKLGFEEASIKYIEKLYIHLFLLPLEIINILRQLIFVECLLSWSNEVQMEANWT